MKQLTKEIFEGQPEQVKVACVDYDQLLKFGDDVHIRYTWASERWRGCNWLSEVENSGYEPLTMIRR